MPKKKTQALSAAKKSNSSRGAKAKPTSKKPKAGGNKKRFWLVKSEPEEFSIDDLAKSPQKTTCWDGVRNYQARNTLRDEMQVGDLVLFYHSNAKPPGIAGICKVVRAGYPDHTAFDPNDKHFDPKSNAAEPTWYMVDLQLVEKFEREIALPLLKEQKKLEGMVLLQRGSRLSVQPVTEKQFQVIEQLSRREP